MKEQARILIFEGSSLRSSHLIDRSKLPGWIEGDVMNGDFAQPFRFALLVVAAVCVVPAAILTTTTRQT